MKPPNLSATQIDMARDCLRKWAFRYISDLPKPEPGPGAELGARVHAVAEAYLMHGTAPDRDTLEGAIFIEGLPYLPKPGSGGVEKTKYIEIGGIKYVLIIDLFTRGSLLPEWLYAIEFIDQPVILDHKTSKNPGKYGLTTETLPTNVQALIYAYYALSVTDRSQIGLRWVYYKTEGRFKAYPVDVLLSSDDIITGFNNIVAPVSEKLVELYGTRPDPNSLDATPESCPKYGGCPFMGACKLTPGARVAGLMEDKMNKPMSIKEKLAMEAAQQGRVGAVQPGDGVNPPVPGRNFAFPAPAVPGPPPPPPAPRGQVAQGGLSQAPTVGAPPPPPVQTIPATNQTIPATNQAMVATMPNTRPFQTVIAPSTPLQNAVAAQVEEQLPAAIGNHESRIEAYDRGHRVALVCALIRATAGNITPAKAASEADKYLKALIG